MKRYELLQNIQPLMADALVVCNIGIPSQELYAIGDQDNYFYMLGGMGLCCSVGLGLAQNTGKPVLAIEGDGAVLMNMGALATIGNSAPGNFTLMIVDNGSYGSTGDQATFTSRRTRLADVARGAGCEHVVECNGEDIAAPLEAALKSSESTVIVVKVESGNQKVGAIPLNPVIIRERFRARAQAQG